MTKVSHAQRTRHNPQPRTPLFQRLLLATHDYIWMHYYNLVSTWGVSVMEPWERIVVLSLTVGLLVLLGLAAKKVPSYAGFVVDRVVYYLVGSGSAAMVVVVEGDVSTTAKAVQGEMTLRMCQQALESGLLTLDSPKGLVPVAWSVSS